MRLRWNICKALGKPLDDPMFKEMSSVQWLAYSGLIQKDQQNEEEKWRDRLEYLARFWDSESVDKVQMARESEQGGEIPDDHFNKVLERNFGRSLGSGVGR